MYGQNIKNTSFGWTIRQNSLFLDQKLFYQVHNRKEESSLGWESYLSWEGVKQAQGPQEEVSWKQSSVSAEDKHHVSNAFCKYLYQATTKKKAINRIVSLAPLDNLNWNSTSARLKHTINIFFQYNNNNNSIIW